MNHARLVLLSLLCFSCITRASDSRYEERPNGDPDGIGRSYMGREIAQVMGPGGIAWLERNERDFEEKPALVIEALNIEQGQVIADLGAGSGYYSFRLAQQVGESGKVLAIDIEPTMLQVIRDRAARQGIRNVETVRSTETDPKLSASSIDLLLMVDVYHELAFPYEMMGAVVNALKPGGRVALVEYRKEDPEIMIKEAHKMSERQIIREMQAVGLEHVRTATSLPVQHLVIFRKP